MNFTTNASLSPTDVRDYFVSQLPSGELPGIFFELSSQSLLHSIGTFYSGIGTRPSCTLENVVATVRYHNINDVLRMLSTDAACSGWVLHLQHELARQAVLQVAGVVTFIDVILEHVQPQPETQQRINAFIGAFAA